MTGRAAVDRGVEVNVPRWTRAGWLALWMAGCGPVDTLDEDEFLDAYAARWCELAPSCGVPCDDPADAPVPEPPGTGDPCTFDPDAGQQCLDEGWTCAPDYGSGSLPAPANSCARVYVCPTWT